MTSLSNNSQNKTHKGQQKNASNLWSRRSAFLKISAVIIWSLSRFTKELSSAIKNNLRVQNFGKCFVIEKREREKFKLWGNKGIKPA